MTDSNPETETSNPASATAEASSDDLQADNGDVATAEDIGVFADPREIVDDPGHVQKEPPRVGTSDELHMDPYGQEQLDISRDDFAQLLEEREDEIGEFREGQIVNARVLSKTETAAVLEFGFKSEGSVALEEFKEEPEIGDEVEVLLEHLEDDDGIVVLSKKKADFLRVWEKIKEAYDNDEPVPGTLAQKIKGGVTVDLMGVDAFLPGSQIALRRVPNIEDLIGNTYEFQILKLNKRRRNIVISRRVLLEAEREKKREHLEKELLVGQVRQGQVKNITDFGAFIDLGGLDGLLHITDMSWGRVGHPSEVVDIGDDLDIKVLDIDWDRERISLGLKQLLPYPWTDIDKKYPVGSRVKGRVVSITNYGAFVELEKGVEGLVHISEMSWTRNVRHPSKLVSIGDEIECVVLKVDPDEEKISLGMKQIEEDPWLALPQKYPTGTRITGEVRNLTSFGAFVEIEPGIDGLVHVSDMSWTKRIEHPSEVVQKGEDVEVVVLDVDAENKRISLGFKQTQEDPWPEIAVRFAEGVETEGEVVRIQDKGLVVDLGDDIEGFVPASHANVDDPGALSEAYEPGDQVALKVLESDAANRRIVLEILGVTKAVSEEAPEDEEPEVEAEAAEDEAEGEVEAEAEGEVEAEADAEEAAEAEEAESDDEDAEAVEAEAEVEEAESETEAEEPDEAEAVEAEADAEEAKEAESDEGDAEAVEDRAEEEDEEDEEEGEGEAGAAEDEEPVADAEEEEEEEAEPEKV